MIQNLKKIVAELTGKLPPPLWAVYVYTFYLALKKGKNYEEAKEEGQSEVDRINLKIKIVEYKVETKYDYSLPVNPLLPGFGIAYPFDEPLLLAEVSCSAEKMFDENDKSQLNELNLFDKAQSTLTQDQKNIAEYWDDSKITPPGHLLLIALENNIDESKIEVLLYGFVQAAVGCWAVKYSVKQKRPIELSVLLKDKKFQPVIKTPAHPSSPSGHSTFSSLCAAICEGNTSLPIVDPVGGKRFNNWNEISNEAGISRIYGGIHFHKDNELGKMLGGTLGKYLLLNYIPK